MKHTSIRKPLSVLLSILMALSVFGGMAFTASAESSGTYNGFSWTLGDDGALSITGSGSIGSNDPWFRKGEITSISAIGAIEQIDRDAFFGNQNVTSYTVESTTDLKISQDAFFVYSGSKMETITITAPKITLTNNLYYNYDEPMELIFNGDVYLNPGAFSDVQTFSVHFNNNLYVVIPAGYYVFSGPGANELQSWYSYVARSKEENPEHPEDYERQLSDLLASADEQGCTYTKYEEETTILVNEETIGLVFGSTYVAAQPNCGANGTKAYYVGAGVWDDSVGDFVDTYYLYENGTYFLVTADDLVMAPTGEHDYTDVEWTQADENNHERTCTVCGQTATEAHNWTWKIDTPADCGHDGTKHQECTVCGATKDEGTSISATGEHTYGDWAYADAENHARTCTVCGQTAYEAHDVIVKGAGDADCTNEGYTGDEFCSVCGAKLSEGTIIPAKGHTTAIVGAKEATATEDGYTGDEVCTVCGKTIKTGEVIPATGEDTPDEPETPDEPADGESDGEICGYCGKSHPKTFFGSLIRLIHTLLYFFKTVYGLFK